MPPPQVIEPAFEKQGPDDHIAELAGLRERLDALVTEDREYTRVKSYVDDRLINIRTEIATTRGLITRVRSNA